MYHKVMITEAEFRVTEITEDHIQSVRQLIAHQSLMEPQQAVEGTYANCGTGALPPAR